ncbi:putative metal-dependent hydrolase [Neolewinella aurantiaca]|uniref:Putative metal-dependent hydrolase n=1 Tax=Neolewinella aurantiaca TaxID=2602767 RepID=A0A5C7FNG3_9BACT|nr:putative metal-dependent hydrolase [Neolewinella aurantiaca]TXF89072.1 putative metal-dependent hydrolase [Neolewinella aurantiaca]
MRYPIGKFVLPDHATAAANRTDYIKDIGELPAIVANIATELKRRDLLDTPYREGGWTARQVVHHLADSHTNAYVRHKRILTEDHPTLIPYDEVRWAELADVTAVPIAASLEILRGLHLRWSTLLATCSDADWERTGFHGGNGQTYRLDSLAAQYSWHGRHHVGHLKLVL